MNRVFNHAYTVYATLWLSDDLKCRAPVKYKIYTEPVRRGKRSYFKDGIRKCLYVCAAVESVVLVPPFKLDDLVDPDFRPET